VARTPYELVSDGLERPIIDGKCYVKEKEYVTCTKNFSRIALHRGIEREKVE
jgi:hypothetical protein